MSRSATKKPETRSVSGYLLPRRVGSSADVAAEIANRADASLQLKDGKHIAQLTGSPLGAKALRGQELDARQHHGVVARGRDNARQEPASRSRRVLPDADLERFPGKGHTGEPRTVRGHRSRVAIQ